MQQGFYGPITDDVWDKAKKIRLLICDIDGVFSDGKIYISNQGEELKAFHARDGFGIKELLKNNIHIAIITGRNSSIVTKRMSELGITMVYQGADDKLIPYQEILTNLNFDASNIAYIGDDLPDIAVMKQVGLAVAVADAHPCVIKYAHMVTTKKGGHGALRELIDLILLSQKKLSFASGIN